MVTLPTTALSSIVGMYVIVNNPLAVLVAIVLIMSAAFLVRGPPQRVVVAPSPDAMRSVTINERWGTGTHPRGPRR